VSRQRNKIRVLIVDDTPDVRLDLRLLLEIAGDFEVIGEAGDGREAIDSALCLKPDVVLMDLAMPVVDGYQAAAHLKQKLAACRLVALTVHSAETSRRKALAAGFDAFVVKGAPLQEVLGAVWPLLNNRSSPTGGLS